MKKIVYIGFLFVALICVGFIFAQTQNQIKTTIKNNDNLTIVTSFYPLEEFASQVAGDKATVTNIIPAGTEPHTFDPSPQDIAKLTQADIFIYNGAGFESWIDKIQPDLESNGVQMVNTSQGINLLSGTEDEHQEEEEGEHEEALNDPHFWLDPVYAQIQVENIKNALIQKDPQNKEHYENNATTYKNKLTQLDNQYTTLKTSCQKHDIITSHNAFAYLAKRYNFNAVAISGLSPDEEPSPQKLAEITDFAKKNQIKYIFFESLVSPKLSDTIAKEVGAQTLVFNPIEGLTQEEVSEGKNYISVQEENLNNLKIALECQ